jgi:methylenetetrahydrofolate reductase (NADPH)
MAMDKGLPELIQGDKPFMSIEFFPPKTDGGVESLYKCLEKLKSYNPRFADVTWGAGGSTSDLTLTLCEGVKERGVVPNLHLTCTNMEKEKIDTALKGCSSAGITNILALRGDPPAGQTVWTAKDASFTCALDLVKYIKDNKQFGEFNITVAGYPEGHPSNMKEVPEGLSALSETEKTRYSTSINEETGEKTIICCRDEDYAKEMDYLKSKVDAGATAVITQMFFDPEVFGIFVKDCRNLGITVPIIPGIMCIGNLGGFKRMTGFCKTRIPDAVMAALEKAGEVIGEGEEAIKAAADKVKEAGVSIVVDMCSRLVELGTPGLHFYTLNQSAATIAIMDTLIANGVMA